MSGDWPAGGPDEFRPHLDQQLRDPEVRAGYYEEDEEAGEVVEAFEAGEKGITVPPGAAQLPRPCWLLLDPATGKPYDFEEITHYDDFSEATCAVAAASDVRPDAEPRQLDGPCWTATAECGEKFEADGMILHYPSLEALQLDLDACGWKVVDGRLCCEDCGEVCGQ